MADISKIKLPSGNEYNIKDALARQMISGGISFIIAWNGTSAPTVANIPSGVVITYNSTNYTGTLTASADTVGKFYLVKSSTQVETLDVYEEYATITNGSSYFWEKIGDTKLDISNLGALAYKDSVGASSTDTFVKSYPGTTSKLATTSVPNVTAAGSASSWAFSMGSGNDAETLIITGANGSAPTLGTAITCATGSLAANGGGDSVMTGLGTATTASAVTGVAAS